MSDKETSRFAEEYLALFLDPETQHDALPADFAERASALGFRMDSGAALLAAFPGTQALFDAKALQPVLPQIEDADMLGSAIVSHWHLAQLWGADVLSEQHRSWFKAAFARLAELTRPAGAAQIIVFPEAAALQDEIRVLRAELMDLMDEKAELVYHVVPDLEALYRVTFGSLEYEIYRYDCEVRRLRRKSDLIRARLNRQEKVDERAIDATLKQEFAQYEERLNEQMDLFMKALERRRMPRLSDAQSVQLKRLYRTVLKALHPDLHPESTERQKRLLLEATSAYEDGDLSALESIALLVQEPDAESDANSAGGLQQKRAERDRLAKCVTKIRKEIRQIHSEFPYNEREKLSDPSAAQAWRSDLEALLRQLKDQAAAWEKTVQDLLQGRGK